MQREIVSIIAHTSILSILFISVTGVGDTAVQRAGAWLSSIESPAAIFFVQSISSKEILDDYEDTTVRILVVPGHQPDTGGTEFKNSYEREIVVDIAKALEGYLKENPRYEVMVARTKDAWHPVLQKYFITHADAIEEFRKSQALQMAKHLASGRFVLEEDQVHHNTTPSKAALQLYGINKWASDHDYAITLHLHLNDYAGRRAGRVGRYDGFAIYVPESQYSNASASRELAEAISARLNAYHATSTLPKEDVGIVEDQELIAVGANNSVDGAALLIEYGYIYEPQFQNASVQKVAIAEYAYQTYLGLQDFFNDPVATAFGSVALPYDWSESVQDTSGPSIYALQATLRYLGYYPPSGKSFSDCPVSGRAGSCTHAALEAYQGARGLETTGTLGPKTRTALENDLETR